MKIVFVSKSSCIGGAAVVTTRLMNALAAQGHEVSMLETAEPSSGRIHRLGNPLSRKWKFLRERMGIYLSNGLNRGNLFKVSTASTGFDIARHPLVKDADAVIIGWINQGVLSLSDIRRIAASRPVICVMHDMWWCTGICHHALGCRNYLSECRNCQYLGKAASAADLSNKTFHKKVALLDNIGRNIHFVAVSNWIKGIARESALLSDLDVTVIHNAFPSDYILTPDAASTAPTLDVVFCAARLDDDIKNLPLAIDAVNLTRSGIRLVLVGSLRDTSLLNRIKIPYRWVGPISSQDKMFEIYRRSAVILSTSRFETLPGTIVEGIAAGCMAVATGHGGQSDIIEDKVNGFITGDDPAEIASVIDKAVNMPRPRIEQAESIRCRHSQEHVARQYIELIERVKR